MAKSIFKAGDVLTCVDNDGHKTMAKPPRCNTNGITEGHDYTVLRITDGWPVFIGDDGKEHTCLPSRFKLKEDDMSQKAINVGDTLVVRRGKGTSNLPDDAEVNVLNVSAGNTSVQVLNINGRKEWYGVERFQVKTAVKPVESMIGKTMVVTKAFNPLKIGDIFVVTGESDTYWHYDYPDRDWTHYHPKSACELQKEESMIGKTMVVTNDSYPLKTGETFVITGERDDCWTYDWKGHSGLVHPKNGCKLQEQVVRKKDRWGNTQFEVGDRARFKPNGSEFVVLKVRTYGDTSQTVHYGEGEYDNTSNSSIELIQPETETNMTQVRTPTTKNPSGAIVGDTVLVEGVLTRGPDGDNEFQIKLGNKDAFVPAAAIKSITKKVIVGPKFAVGSTVKMNSAKIAYTDTRKRGKVLFEKNGVYFIEWTGGELGSGKETNSIKEQSLLAA